MKLLLLLEDWTTEIPVYLQIISKAGYNEPKEILDAVLKSDPTNGKYVKWIIKQVKFKNIRLPEDSTRVYQSLEQFIKLKNIPNAPINKDIWQYKKISDLERDLRKADGTESIRQGGLGGLNIESLPGVDKTVSKNGYDIYHITNINTLMELGENTSWCTRKSYPNCMASDYLGSGNVYFITKNNKKYAQFYISKTSTDDPDYQLMDVDDVPIKDDYLVSLISKFIIRGWIQLFFNKNNNFVIEGLYRIIKDFKIELDGKQSEIIHDTLVDNISQKVFLKAPEYKLSVELLLSIRDKVKVLNQVWYILIDKLIHTYFEEQVSSTYYLSTLTQMEKNSLINKNLKLLSNEEFDEIEYDMNKIVRGAVNDLKMMFDNIEMLYGKNPNHEQIKSFIHKAIAYEGLLFMLPYYEIFNRIFSKENISDKYRKTIAEFNDLTNKLSRMAGWN